MRVCSEVSPLGEEWIGEDDALITVDDGSDEGGVKVKFADSTVVMISGCRVGEDGEEDAVMYPYPMEEYGCAAAWY